MEKNEKHQRSRLTITYRVLPNLIRPQIGTDLVVLSGVPRNTVGAGSEAARLGRCVDGTEPSSARTAMGATKAQTNARAASRERRVVEGHMPLAEFIGTLALIFVGTHVEPIALSHVNSLQTWRGDRISTVGAGFAGPAQLSPVWS
jgi:hypothetical protein